MQTAPLQEAGLTKGEIKVYTALLSLGSSTTGPIIEKSGIAKSIVYQILDKLMQKGLISYIVKNKTKYFQASEPGKIMDYIDERDKQLHANKKKVEDLIPQLLLMKNSTEQSHIQIYSGMKGVQTACEHIYQKLKRGEDFNALGVPTYQEKKWHLYWKRDHIRRAKTGITCRLLFNKGTDPGILKNRNSYKGAEARYMPTNVKSPAWILNYKDTTAIILQSGNGLAIEIVNQEIADSFKSYFEEFWKETKPFS